MALSRDSILKHAGSIDTREVHVPKWADENGDDVVIVRGMTIREFELHQARLTRAGDDENKLGKANAQLIARCVVGDDGRRVFSDADVNQIAELGLGDVLRLSSAIQDLSGLNDDAEDEARGESVTAQTSSSASE